MLGIVFPELWLYLGEPCFEIWRFPTFQLFVLTHVRDKGGKETNQAEPDDIKENKASIDDFIPDLDDDEPDDPQDLNYTPVKKIALSKNSSKNGIKLRNGKKLRKN